MDESAEDTKISWVVKNTEREGKYDIFYNNIV